MNGTPCLLSFPINCSFFKKTPVLIAFLASLLGASCGIVEPASEAYIFTYQSSIREFYLPNCMSDSLAKIMQDGSRVEEKLLGNLLKNLPEGEVRKICEEMHHQVTAAYPLVKDDRAENLQNLLAAMKPFLAQERANLAVYLIDCSVPNAFTLPDGRIYFTASLYERLVTEHGRAFVLAHELGHYENLHPYKTLARAGLLPGGSSEPFFLLESPHLLRADEMEADLAACYLSFKAGYDPKVGAKQFYLTAQGKNWQESNIFNRLDTKHPFLEERYGCLLSYLDIAEQEALTQAEIGKYHPEMSWLGLFWLNRKKNIIAAVGILLAIAALVALWRRVPRPNRGGAFVCYSIFILMIGVVGYWLGKEKNSEGDNCNCSGKVMSHFPNNAVLREQPSVNSHALAVLSKGDTVKLLAYAKRELVNNRRFRWRKVKWQDKTGYVWEWMVVKG